MTVPKTAVDGSDILMQTCGVFRCCISSILDTLNPDEKYAIGTPFKCEHCKREFELKPNIEGELVIAPNSY